MKTTVDYKNFVVESLGILGDISCKAMMGEYLLYYDDILFGGIYENRLLIKIVPGNEKYKLQEEIPYKSAKPMYLFEDFEDEKLLKNIIIDTCTDLIKIKSTKKISTKVDKFKKK